MALPMKVDHLQVTVKDVNKVEAFYDGLMEALGFDLNKKINVYLEELDMQVIEYLDSSYDFGICSALSQLCTEESPVRFIILLLEPPLETKSIECIK